MKKIIMVLILISLIFPLTSGLNYRVNLNYSNHTLSVSSVEIDYFSVQTYSEGRTSVVLRDIDKNILYTKNFDLNPTAVVHYKYGEGGELVEDEVVLENFEFYFIIPYLPNATSLEILSADSSLLSEYNLGELSKVPIEESKGISVVKKNQKINEETTGIAKETPEEGTSIMEKVSNNLWILVVVVLLLLAILVYVLSRKKTANNKPYN